MNILSEYNKFTILGHPMKPYSFILLFSLFSLTISLSQQYDAKSNSLARIGLRVVVVHTTYTDREILKSGWDKINGHKMRELKLQLRF